MKILIFIGSLRKLSFNRAVANRYRELAEGSHQFVEASYDDFPLYNDDIKNTSIPEPVSRVDAQIQDADAILVFCPEYNYTIPGAFKNAIDWLSRVPKPSFNGKPAAILSASSGRLGGARMQYDLRKVGVALGLEMLNKPEIMIGEAQNKMTDDGKFNDPATEKLLQKHFDEFMKHCKR